MEDRLRKFACLVESGNFTRAAQKLRISQPALTLAINKLERELKTPLLIRDRRQLQLTDAGRLVYQSAVEHRVAGENLRTRLVELAHERPKVAIGMIDSVAATLNKATGPLDDLESQADVSIIVNNSRYLRSAVENREIDMAFAVHDPVSYPALEVIPAGTEPFVLVCRPDNLDMFQTALAAKKLPQFICYDPHSTTYGHIYSGLRKLRVRTRPILHSTSPDIMINTVLRGRGVAALPRVLIEDLVKKSELAPLRQAGGAVVIDCPLDSVKSRGKQLPKALEDFSDGLRLVLSDDRQTRPKL